MGTLQPKDTNASRRRSRIRRERPGDDRFGDFSRTVILESSHQGTVFRFRDSPMNLVLRPKIEGSSRGSLRVFVRRATLTNQIPLDGEIEIHFRATGMRALERARRDPVRPVRLDPPS